MFYVYTKLAKISMLTKTKGYFLGLNSFLLKNASKNLRSVNPINIYSGRGVRLSKQVIRKKVGKVSMYM